MTLDDFDYYLPPERIAQEPTMRRDASRLMVLDRDSGTTRLEEFNAIVDLFRPGDLVVLNNARVFPARVRTRRSGGGKSEVLFLEPLDESPRSPRPPTRENSWEALIRPARWARKQKTIALEDDVELEVVCEIGEGRFEVRVEREGHTLEAAEVVALCEKIGEVPLPPYIKRIDSDGRAARDVERYQTIFAESACAAAAPTAGLHFTQSIFDSLHAAGVDRVEITHQVGLGTFLPLREDDVERSTLHSEWSLVPIEVGEKINAARSEGRRIVAVGTTTARALESFAIANTPLPYHARTELFIQPGFEFQLVDAMVTNFHLPRSSLLYLVSAFASREQILLAYQRAIAEQFRFYSYGDAMFIV
jgi:S-adenosylmethionine:tRNA ribosyltransferase-isomerase